ncbi:predicted protein [Naegleria gruberi]|uniref:Predicted protein n=1 Tax=Naegleria gruberi TaxID=5762 RepID=D2VCV6_NAEGR|nr:uncharacterized protein NAEGRDRAFT_66706 [Naegleria gruberi]EFC45372.1 predicted protein [Naegleria gruberi]|eukprot:XP_002678116.1 predicted protein [Naegleria gruberi strain NEG-M]
MEVIEEKRLFTDLPYRFAYVAKFVGFGEEDVKYIHESAAVLAPLVPTVVDLVYKKLFSFDVTKKTFMVRNDKFQGKMEDTLDELSDTSSEQIKFRKDMLSKYLVKLVTADYSDPALVKYLDWVGKIHTTKAGNKDIVIDYIHINALFGYVSDVLLGTIAMCPQLNEEQRAKTVQAFNKLLWIQNDLFAKYYVDDDSRHGITQPESTESAPSSGGCCFGFKSAKPQTCQKTCPLKPLACISIVAAASFFLGKYLANK